MTLNWLAPGYLLLFALLPLLLLIYALMLRGRRLFTVRYSSLALVRAGRQRWAWLRRHLPFALFLLAVGSLVGALARPVTDTVEPIGEATILLALDISSSMCSTDIAPTRLAAAKAAALDYINSQGSGARIGLVAFAGFAQLIQRPTTNHADLEVAIRSLVTSRGTAIGDGLTAAVKAITALHSPDAPAEPLPEGVYPPEIIVLLTDGVTTVGEPPLEAAQAAVANRIRIYTIGFGTANGGENSNCDQPLFDGGQPIGAGEAEAAVGSRGIDEATLIQLAELSGGAYYAAESAGELQRVFRSLPTAFITETRTLEITVIFAAVGALLAALALLLSAHWQPLM